MPAITRLSHLPHDILLHIADHLTPTALSTLSTTTPFWTHFALNYAWPRRVANILGVRAIHHTPPTSVLPPVATHQPPDAHTWHRLFTNFSNSPSARILSVCVRLSPHDSITSLALEFSLSTQDILRANSLFYSYQAASRTHLYIPLLTDDSVKLFTGQHTCKQVPYLVKDNLLSKHFLVVKFRSYQPPTPQLESAQSRRESYVKQLIVKLIAKGLSVDEHEVRFYLDDNDFDVAKAYKQLLADHQFCP